MIAPLYLGVGKFLGAVALVVAGYHGAKAAIRKLFK